MTTLRTRLVAFLAALLAVTMASCSASVTAGSPSITGPNGEPLTTASPSAPPTGPPTTGVPGDGSNLAAQATTLCDASAAGVGGTADLMVPADTQAIVICDLATFTPSRPDSSGVIESDAEVAAIVSQLNVIAPPAGIISCTQIGGGTFSAVFLAPSANVKVGFDRVNCVSATNGPRTVVGVGGVIAALDAAMASSGEAVIVARI